MSPACGLKALGLGGVGWLQGLGLLDLGFWGCRGHKIKHTHTNTHTEYRLTPPLTLSGEDLVEDEYT